MDSWLALKDLEVHGASLPDLQGLRAVVAMGAHARSSAEAKLIALDMISSLAAANSTWRSIACPLCLSSSFSSSLFRFLCELAWRNILIIARFLILALFWQDYGGDRGAADIISDDSKSIINTRCSFIFYNMFAL
jgi:hypothetical protein